MGLSACPAGGLGLSRMITVLQLDIGQLISFFSFL